MNINSSVVPFILAALIINFGQAISPNNVKAHAPTPPTSELEPIRNATAIPICTTRDAPMKLKNGIIDPRFRWTNFYVHADIAYSQQEHQIINNAMYNLMQILPCVNFGIYPPDSNPDPNSDYVRIVKGTSNGCNSYVGRQGRRQIMNLQSPGCVDVGTVMHEMIHALGFDHEHNRPDRDDFVDILWDNIENGLAYAFYKNNPAEYSTFGVPYNYRSIMHYHSTAFSSNGRPTMQAKTGEEIGSVGRIQDTDSRKLKLMYNC